MKLKIVDASKIEKGSMDMPMQFNEIPRPDLIQRAVLSIQSNKRQPYGTDPEAGRRQSATISKRRKDFKGCYGMAISRTPRKIFSRSGTRFNWGGAVAPQTVGGRRSHPPKAEKIWSQKMNKGERRKAIRSAMACTLMPEMIKARGHIINNDFPFIVESSVEDIKKTKDVVALLEKLGFTNELERAEQKKVRAGKGKSRGRKYRKKTGPLIVVSKDCAMMMSARNIPGVDVEIVNRINCELLAPGCVPGRLTIWTKPSIERIAKENLFIHTQNLKPKQEEKAKEEKTEAKQKPAAKKETAKAAAKPKAAKESKGKNK